MKKASPKVFLKLLETNDYLLWKSAYEGQQAPQNSWDRAHRNQDLSKKKFNELLKTQKKNIKEDKNHSYGIFDKKTGKLVGFIMAMDIIRGISHTAYLGYVIFNQYWGQGYAPASISAFYKVAFQDLGLHRLQAGIEPHNKRSLKVARSLGMRREGISKKIIYLRGEWQDLVQFAITAEDVKIKWKGIAQKNY